MVSVKNSWLVAWVFCRLRNGGFLWKRGYLIGKLRKEMYFLMKFLQFCFTLHVRIELCWKVLDSFSQICPHTFLR